MAGIIRPGTVIIRSGLKKVSVAQQERYVEQQRQREADRQTRLLTVTPDAAFEPVYGAALPNGTPILPLLIGGVLLALYLFKK